MEPLLAAAGFAGLFGATATVFVQLLRQNATLRHYYQDDIKTLRAENDRCTKRVNVLVYALQQHGIQVPVEVWDGYGNDPPG